MLDEIYYLVKEMGFSYADILIMPTFERKYFINKFIGEIEERKEAQRKSGK